MLVKETIKANIREAFNTVRGDTDSPDISIDDLSGILADAVIEAIKSMQITYTAGLMAPPMGGAVTGTFQCEIQ